MISAHTGAAPTPACLVSAGCINVDLLARVQALPASDSRLVCEQPFGRWLGGMATNVACAAAALGAPLSPRVELIGPLADDGDGAWVLEELSQHGVVTSWLDRQAQHTNRCLILLEPDGSRALIGEPSRLDYLQVHRRLVTPLPLRQHLHCDGYHAPGLLEALIQAQAQGWSTSTDVDELAPDWLNPEGIQKLLACCDWLFINHGHATRLWGDPDIALQTARLQAMVRVCGGGVVLTLGGDGARLITPQRVQEIPPLPVAVVDTTGAGDIFAGVFLATWLAGLAPPAAARWASTAAGLSTTALGALGFLANGGLVEQSLAALPR